MTLMRHARWWTRALGFGSAIVLFVAPVLHAVTTTGPAQPHDPSRVLPASGVTPGQCWEAFLAGLDMPELAFFYDLRFAQVKFEDRYRVRLRAQGLVDMGEEAILDQTELAASLAVLDRWGVRWSRGAPDVTEEAIDALREGAVHPEGRAVPDLNNVYLLQIPDAVGAAAVVRELQGRPGVDYALFVSRALPAPQAVGGTVCIPDFSDVLAATDTNLFPGAQWYLEGVSTNRPVGIDAFYAWEGIYGDGSGVTIVDVEYNFSTKHVDLPNVEVLASPGLGLPQDLTGDHGTAVLGVLGGRNNGFGVTGIAHGAKLKFTSEWRKAYDFFGRETAGVNNRFAAIVQATAHAGAGDLIVLEMQAAGPNGQLVPAEWDRTVYDATVAAVASGRVVVAAAGNGGANLDAAAFSSNVPGWSAGQGPFQANNRSGALIVGGAVPAGFPDGAGGLIQGLVPTTNAGGGTTFGSRLDLQGWGQWVMTTGYGGIVRAGAPDCYRPMNNDVKFLYTGSFNGTSSATPIVAGAAAILQSTFKNARGRVATPAELRNLLVSTGTPQGPGNTIGPLPNLRAAIESLADPAVLNPAPPVVEPAFGPKVGNLIMQLGYSAAGQNFDNTLITYTLDGSDPTLESYRFIPEFDSGLFLRRTVTVKTRTFRRDAALQRWFAGPILEGRYEFSDKIPPVRFVSDSTGDPVASGDGVSWPFALRLESEVPNALIRYTVGPWDESAALAYTAPLPFNAGTYLIVAKAYREGLVASDLSGISFTVVQYGANSAGGQILADPPLILPASGVYPSGISVSITPPHPFASVRYTLDGTEPDEAASLYSSALVLTSSAVVKARTFAPGTLPSETATESYSLMGGLEAPAFTPAGGGFLGSQPIRLSHPEDTAVIRYTIGGAEPGVSSTVYDGPINLPPGVYVLKAKAFLDNAPPSGTSTAQFTFFDPASAVQPPVMLPRLTAQTLIFTLSFEIPTQGAIVHYTINDPDPAGYEVTTSDIAYDPANPPQLGALPGGREYLIRARAFKDGQGSLQVQQNYNVFWPFDAENNRLEVAEVTIEPDPGVYHDTVRLIFRTDTPAVQFRYTSDASLPPESPTTGTANNRNNAFQSSESFPVTLNRSALVNVAATRLGYFASPLTEAEYVLRCALPSFASSLQEDGSWEVTLSTLTPNATLRYTTDGSDPTAESPVFEETLVFGPGAHLLQARAFRTNFEASEIQALLLNVDPAPALPVITRQPEAVTAMVGDTVAFSVEATGYPAPSYAWKRDDLLLGENHSTLELLDVQPSDAATYSVTVFNANGSIDSSPVALVVTPVGLTDIENWREQYFGRTDNEGDAADHADPDNDGSPNRDEFAAGTDPTDPESLFRIREVSRDPTGGVSLTLGTADQRRYRVLLSFDLVEWQPLVEDIEGSGAELSIPLESPGLEDHPQAYFRIELMVQQP